jgi:hypothetical protein
MPDSMIYMPSPTWSSLYIAERFLKRRTAIRLARTSNLPALSSERPFNRAKFCAVILPGGLTERPLIDAGRLDLFLGAIVKEGTTTVPPSVFSFSLLFLSLGDSLGA